MTPTARAAEELDALMRTPQRPQVVFCDWHGVLSHSLYWQSITENPEHPAHSILRDELSRLFTTGNADGRDWMRGRLSTREILTRATEHHPHLDLDRLCAQLADDITTMPVDQILLRALARARDQAAVVLATDNITDFATAFHIHATTPGPTVDCSDAAVLGYRVRRSAVLEFPRRAQARRPDRVLRTVAHRSRTHLHGCAADRRQPRQLPRLHRARRQYPARRSRIGLARLLSQWALIDQSCTAGLIVHYGRRGDAGR